MFLFVSSAYLLSIRILQLAKIVDFAVSERFRIFANEFVRKKIARGFCTFAVGNNK